MSSITVSNVAKGYKYYATQWARLSEWLAPWSIERHTVRWVLRDISFEISAGEAVGIVGENGAGKSTLLKMITGTVQPSRGDIQIEGRVAALLELGMGFHPDFTGRQNAVMAGQLLGLTDTEIEELMPGVESFAAIGDYIDMPVRVYSSGMHVRLAFAVATALRPDVLIVDEVLSVGDAAFQRKCFQRIEDYRAAGTTLLLVSHDVETVKKLCDKVLFLKDGRVADFGKAKHVCDEYERYLFGDHSENVAHNAMSIPEEDDTAFDPSLKPDCEIVYGNGKAEILGCWLENDGGRRVNIVPAGETFYWCYAVQFSAALVQPIFAMMVKNVEGVALYGVDSTVLDSPLEKIETGATVTVRFRLANVLSPGVYYLNCGVREYGEGYEYLSRRVDSGILKVTASRDSTVLTGLVEMGALLEVASIH